MKRWIIFISFLMLFLSINKRSFAYDFENLPEGVSWFDWTDEEKLRHFPYYDLEYEANLSKTGKELYGTLTKSNGREYYIKTFSGGFREYTFIDAKISEDKWIYSTAWVPDNGSSYYIEFPARSQADIYSSKKTGANHYWVDPNGLYITTYTLPKDQSIPQTVVVPKTIGGKPVVGVWLTGRYNVLGYTDGPKIIYMPSQCAIISGESYFDGDRPNIIRY